MGETGFVLFIAFNYVKMQICFMHANCIMLFNFSNNIKRGSTEMLINIGIHVPHYMGINHHHVD